jgi:hypothetical protein
MKNDGDFIGLWAEGSSYCDLTGLGFTTKNFDFYKSMLIMEAEVVGMKFKASSPNRHSVSLYYRNRYGCIVSTPISIPKGLVFISKTEVGI